MLWRLSVREVRAGAPLNWGQFCRIRSKAGRQIPVQLAERRSARAPSRSDKSPPSQSISLMGEALAKSLQLLKATLVVKESAFRLLYLDTEQVMCPLQQLGARHEQGRERRECKARYEWDEQGQATRKYT